MPRVRFFFPHPGKGAGDFTVRLYRLSPTLRLLVELVTTYEVSSADLPALQDPRWEGTEAC